MRIFFDGQTFVNQQYGGISRYFCELITGINKVKENCAHLSLLWSNNVHVKDYELKSLSYPFKHRHRFLAMTNNLYNDVDYFLNKFDVYHATYYNDFLIKDKNKKSSITTFHDMTYEALSTRFKELSDDKTIIQQKAKMARKVTHIISVSENTKNDLINYLGIEPNKISVVHLASSLKNQAIENEDRLVEKPYLLFIGKRAGYKNFQLLLESISDILIKYNICLICGGGGQFSQIELQTISKLRVEHLVHHYNVNDYVLCNLYKNAEAFIFPSLYEGFGIPILEAFSCGCPCIISNTSSLPEVANEAAYYFEPEEKESIQYAVEKVLIDNSLRKKLILSGEQRIKQFSWEKTVHNTLEIYKKFV